MELDNGLPFTIFMIRTQNGKNLIEEAGAGHLKRISQPFHYHLIGPTSRIYISMVAQLLEAILFTTLNDFFQLPAVLMSIVIIDLSLDTSVPQLLLSKITYWTLL